MTATSEAAERTSGSGLLANGTRGALDMAADHRAWLDAQETLTACALCSWEHRGPAADGREAARLHRDREHPELALAPRRRLTSEQQRARAMARSEWRRRRFRGEEG